jgi:hypothetical protein
MGFINQTELVPSPLDIHRALRAIERAENPNVIEARKRIQEYRERHPEGYFQLEEVDHEARRKRLIASSLRFRRISPLAWMRRFLGWV